MSVTLLNLFVCIMPCVWLKIKAAVLFWIKHAAVYIAINVVTL